MIDYDPPDDILLAALAGLLAGTSGLIFSVGVSGGGMKRSLGFAGASGTVTMGR